MLRALALEPPGIGPELFAAGLREAGRDAAPKPRPLHVLWAARWEFDKAPERFFAALDCLAARAVDFWVSVLGQSFDRVPEVFATARHRLGDRVERWGYLDRVEDYRRALAEADVFVSTADHEFFGLSAVEAAAAGARPLLPRRLAYPEIFPQAEHDVFFYGGFYGGSEPERKDEVGELADRLEHLAARLAATGSVWRSSPDRAVRAVARLGWTARAPGLDEALSALAR